MSRNVDQLRMEHTELKAEMKMERQELKTASKKFNLKFLTFFLRLRLEICMFHLQLFRVSAHIQIQPSFKLSLHINHPNQGGRTMARMPRSHRYMRQKRSQVRRAKSRRSVMDDG